ncbi:2-phosphosulfolactate phosphatase [Streptomyces sp. NPDC051940]|uniref:2-phosphosulfolactate phosphatase n=1 Tax=Streptomyces sp. NPDC051940 TaxID=3155675 RepID=UPI00343F5C78
MSPRYAAIRDLSALDAPPRAAVVIDVLRAFTVAPWLLARGASRVVLAESLEEALALKEAHPGWLALKDGAPAPGFDAVNSPGMIRGMDLTGRTVIQKTTYGTVGATAVADAPLLLCASFAVAEATARALRGVPERDVTFVVTGEDGTAEEDLACAQYIARRAADGDAPGDPAPFLDRARRSKHAAHLAEGVRLGHRGIHADDVALCLEADRFPFALRAVREDGLLTLRRADGTGGGVSPATSR